MTNPSAADISIQTVFHRYPLTQGQAQRLLAQCVADEQGIAAAKDGLTRRILRALCLAYLEVSGQEESHLLSHAQTQQIIAQCQPGSDGFLEACDSVSSPALTMLFVVYLSILPPGLAAGVSRDGAP